MAESLAMLTLAGNLSSKGAEMSYDEAGNARTKFSVCRSSEYTKRNGETAKEVDWYNVSVNGKRAETCNTYLVPGQHVIVTGKLTLRKWKSEDGVEHISPDVLAYDVVFGAKPKPKEGEAEATQEEVQEGIPFA